VRVQPNAQVAVVEQKPEYDPEMSVLEVIYAQADSPQAAAVRRYQAALASGEEHELQAALEGMDRDQAWDWEARVTQVVEELGLGMLKDRQMGQLSGGEERRVALACALVDLKRTDLLVLDEPTNHLSAEGCEWLQETLQGLEDVAVLLVTHDRYFLDQVCDQILEIDGLGDTFSHPGGWNVFLQRRAERFETRAAQVNDAKVQLKRAEEWVRRGPQGRGTKNKAQIAGYHDVKDKAQAVIAADDGTPQLDGALGSAKIGGRGQRTDGSSSNFGKVGLENATVLRENGEAILDQVYFSFSRGTKLGIVGPNGAGKSTFLRALAGEFQLDGGKRELGDSVRLGYLSQEPPRWADPRQKVMSAVAEMADEALLADDSFLPEIKGMTRERATASLLKSVNFAEERWHTQVSMLSGGEVRRLQLLRVLSQGPNVLLLDEPTNDLDAVTVDALERLLQPWPGTVILVSHDRSLLDGVCETLLVFPKDGGSPRLWSGSHAELREYERQAEATEQPAAAAVAAPADEAAQAAPVTKVLSQAERREQRKAQNALRKVEQQIEKVEAGLEEVQAEMERQGGDAEKVMELHERTQELEAEQEELYAKWEELASSIEG